MHTPPARERTGGDDERPPARRPADQLAPHGEALVERLVDRVAQLEDSVRSARAALAESEAARTTLSAAVRQLVDRPGGSVDALARLALPTLGDWAAVEQKDAPRTLVTAGEDTAGDLDPAVADDDHRIVAPIVARGEHLGTLTFGRAAGAAAPDLADRRLAAEVAALAALAIAQRRAAMVAEEAARAKAEFLTMMSHELRTPLNAIAGYAQLLEMGFRGPLNDAQREAVQRILHGQTHLLELVDSVLTFSRLTSGRLELDGRDVSAGDILATASDPLRAEFAEAEVALELIPCAPAVRVHADRDRTAQILRHLFANAIKFTPRGGSVTARCEPEGTMVRFVVADTGRGIPEDQREAVFRPFVQAETGYTRSADGSGLGLAIARELAERMGGTLTVTSEVGVGSRFVLSLARAAGEQGGISIDSASGAG